MASKLEFELSFNNHEEALRLPVNPRDPEMNIPGKTNNWETTEVGEFKAIGRPGLLNTKIASFFPAHNYSFCTYSNFPSPERCRDLIKKWMYSKRPIRFIVAKRGKTYINEAFAIENFSFSKEEATGDINFELSLEEYRFAEDATVSDEKDTRMAVITLIKGQTLGELADEWLGNSDRWKEIADLNELPYDGHPWAATEKFFHQLWIVCEEGTPGYDRLSEQVEGLGNG